MKTHLIYVLLGLSTALFSCTTQPKAETAIITGKVDVNWSNTMKLSNGAITLTDSWIDRLNVGDSIIDLQADGSFKIKLSLEKPDFYSLSHELSQVDIFLSPSDSLYIDFTSETLFSGTGAMINDHLRSLRGIINSNRRYINGIEFFDQPTGTTDAILDSLKSVYLDAHKKFKESNPVDPIFEEKALADITYRTKLYELAHPGQYNQRTKEMLPVQETYFEDVVQGSFNNPSLLKSLDYVLFLDGYLDVQSAGDYKFGSFYDKPIEKIHPKYRAIQQLDAHQEIKDHLFHEHLNKSIDNYGITYLEDLLPSFKEDCKNPEFIRRIEERVDAARERRQEPSEIKIYKTVDNIELEAHIFYPEDFKEGDKRPAYLFFHGGGWALGIPEWGYKNCKNYSSKGMVAISFEYRLVDIHDSNIQDCIRDAKSAISWTRQQAESLGIDPDKIVAAGFSAGGHLAASTAIIKEFNEAIDAEFSPKPNAIVVHSASYNTTKSDWFASQSNQKPESISTFHNLDKDLVPSIFFHGTDDHLAPISEFTEFRDKMDALGNDYEYKIFENVGHFFNDPAAREEVGRLTDAFFVKLGYIAQ